MSSDVTRYVAFLRGINVGGRRVTGEQLRTPFVALGFRSVDTFLASGNVVFDAVGHTPAAELEEAVGRALASALGYEVRTFLRSEAETARIAAHRPFPDDVVAASAGRLQVAMLPREPSAATRAEVLDHGTAADRLALDHRELYWLPSGGISDSDLDLAAIERLVGPMTMRTANTVARITAKYLAGS